MAFRNDRNPPRQPNKFHPKKTYESGGYVKLSDESLVRGAEQFRSDRSPRHPEYKGQSARGNGKNWYDQPRTGGHNSGYRSAEERQRDYDRPQRQGYAQPRQDSREAYQQRQQNGPARPQSHQEGRPDYSQRPPQRGGIRTLSQQNTAWQKSQTGPNGYQTLSMGDLMKNSPIAKAGPTHRTAAPPPRRTPAPQPIQEARGRTARVEDVERGGARNTAPVIDRNPARSPAREPEQDGVQENVLAGRNPIREALKAGRDLEKLMVAKGDLSGSAREIVAIAREKHIPVQEVDRAALDAVCSAHQGLVAYASAYRYASIDDIFARAEERGEEPFIVILDGITDPHNLGAIIRTAECAGAHGVVVPERRAVGLTSAAVKASAGAVEHLPVARTTNLTKLIETLKNRGLWIIAGTTQGEPYESADLSGAVALVIGGEGDGVSRLVLENCDKQAALPLLGKTGSLNASVAAGVLMYEVVRRRRA